MVTLFISSVTERAGKTLLAAGLAKYWLNSGKKVAYFRIAGPENDRDTEFMHRFTGSRETPEQDILIVEGLLSSLNTYQDCAEGKVIIVHDFAVPLAENIAGYKKLGSRLVGVVLNKVPPKSKSGKSEKLPEEIKQAALPFPGVIYEDRILAALSVANLAEAVQGKILNNSEKSGELVENYLIGNSTFDRGAIFHRKENKAVLIWGERPGFRKAVLSNSQLAALDTSTRCIVISSNIAPIPAVTRKAEEKQVPLISAPGTLPEIIAAIEKAFSQAKFNQDQKLTGLESFLRSRLNFQQLESGLGLS
jgi:uncharacterized protein